MSDIEWVELLCEPNKTVFSKEEQVKFKNLYWKYINNTPICFNCGSAIRNQLRDFRSMKSIMIEKIKEE